MGRPGGALGLTCSVKVSIRPHHESQDKRQRRRGEAEAEGGRAEDGDPLPYLKVDSGRRDPRTCFDGAALRGGRWLGQTSNASLPTSFDHQHHHHDHHTTR